MFNVSFFFGFFAVKVVILLLIAGFLFGVPVWYVLQKDKEAVAKYRQNNG